MSELNRRRYAWNRPQYPAFTLIEVLVVVAIIALLISVLLPSLTRAREQARAAVCLSHMEQQGVGLATYAADFKGTLPWAGSFRFSLMEGKYYLGYTQRPEMEDWVQTNLGALYPRYCGKGTALFYCPNNKAVDENGKNGRKAFLQRYQHQKRSDPQWSNSHTFPDSPFSSYGYGIPLMPAKYPKHNGARMYPQESIRYGGVPDTAEYPYWVYLTTSTDPDPSFLGPFPQAVRGKHAQHAIVSDGYFASEYEGDHSVYEGYHLKGYNVLYGDMHGRRVNDPNGKIHAAKLSPVRPWSYGGMNGNESKVYQVWDYFSRQR